MNGMHTYRENVSPELLVKQIHENNEFLVNAQTLVARLRKQLANAERSLARSQEESILLNDSFKKSETILEQNWHTFVHFHQHDNPFQVIPDHILERIVIYAKLPYSFYVRVCKQWCNMSVNFYDAYILWRRRLGWQHTAPFILKTPKKPSHPRDVFVSRCEVESEYRWDPCLVALHKSKLLHVDGDNLLSSRIFPNGNHDGREMTLFDLRDNSVRGVFFSQQIPTKLAVSGNLFLMGCRPLSIGKIDQFSEGTKVLLDDGKGFVYNGARLAVINPQRFADIYTDLEMLDKKSTLPQLCHFLHIQGDELLSVDSKKGSTIWDLRTNRPELQLQARSTSAPARVGNMLFFSNFEQITEVDLRTLKTVGSEFVATIKLHAHGQKVFARTRHNIMWWDCNNFGEFYVKSPYVGSDVPFTAKEDTVIYSLRGLQAVQI